jgi:nitroreductase
MNAFETFKEIVQKRRTVKPGQMNGQIIPEQDIKDIIETANWAPTHGRTEPWRLLVLTGENLKKFCEHHAQLYWANTPEDVRTETKANTLANMGNKASHLIIMIMKRTPETKIIVEEEYAAVAAATQNMLLAATAKGIASFWSTGGMTHHPSMKMYLELPEADLLMGLLYFGYTDEHKKGLRKTTIEEKTIWV